MLDFLLVIAFWLPLASVVGWYLFSRPRRLPRAQAIAFDAGALLFCVAVSITFFWREITGHISQDIWLDERDFWAFLVPFWTSMWCAPLLVVAYGLRRFLFRRHISEATHQI